MSNVGQDAARRLLGNIHRSMEERREISNGATIRRALVLGFTQPDPQYLRLQIMHRVSPNEQGTRLLAPNPEWGSAEQPGVIFIHKAELPLDLVLPPDVKADDGIMVRVGFYDEDPTDPYIDSVIQGSVKRAYRGRLDKTTPTTDMQNVAGRGHKVEVVITAAQLQAAILAGLPQVAGIGPLMFGLAPQAIPAHGGDIKLNNTTGSDTPIAVIKEGFTSFTHEKEATS